jgi:hypothetical protein
LASCHGVELACAAGAPRAKVSRVTATAPARRIAVGGLPT